eukprot:144232_1
MEPSLDTRTSICLNVSKSSIYALDTTLDGDYIICGGQDKVIRLYNPYKSLLIKSYEGHGYDVQCIKFDHNTKTTFASCGGDKNTFIWDIKTGKILRKLWGHSQRINCLSFNEQFNVIISGSFDQTVLFYDLKAWNNSKPFYALKNNYFKDSVSDVWFSTHEIFIASIDGHLRTFDIRNGKLMTDFICGAGLTSISVTEDKKCILSSCLDDKLRLTNKDTGSLLNEYANDKFINNKYKIKSCLGYNDDTVISGTENGHICIWDLVDKKKEIQILDNKDTNSIVTNVLSHPKHQNSLFSSDTKGNIKLWKY